MLQEKCLLIIFFINKISINVGLPSIFFVSLVTSNFDLKEGYNNVSMVGHSIYVPECLPLFIQENKYFSQGKKVTVFLTII